MKLEQYIRKGSFYEAVVEDGSILFSSSISMALSTITTVPYTKPSISLQNPDRKLFDFILPETRDELKTRFTQSQKRGLYRKVEFQFQKRDRLYCFF